MGYERQMKRHFDLLKRGFQVSGEDHHNGNGNGGVPPSFDLLLRALESRYEERVGQVDHRLNRVEQALSSNTATLEALQKSMSLIAEKVHNPPRTQWGAIAGFAGVALTAAMGYTTLTIGPVSSGLEAVRERQNSTIDAQIQQMLTASFRAGEHEARLSLSEKELEEDDNSLALLMKEVYELQRRLGTLEGEQMMEKRQ